MFFRFKFFIFFSFSFWCVWVCSFHGSIISCFCRDCQVFFLFSFFLLYTFDILFLRHYCIVDEPPQGVTVPVHFCRPYRVCCAVSNPGVPMPAGIIPAGPAYLLRVLALAKIAWLRLRDFCSFVVKHFLSIFFLSFYLTNLSLYGKISYTKSRGTFFMSYLYWSSLAGRVGGLGFTFCLDYKGICVQNHRL
jgi:hypothetical protein